MSANDWLVSLTLGMVAGAIGQLVRAIVGLSKKDDTGVVREFVASRLILSIVIGATAGALATVTGMVEVNTLRISGETILGLMAAGYAGTDVIEGFAGRWTGKSGANPASPNPPSPQPAVNPPSPPAPPPQPEGSDQPKKD